MRNTSTWDPGKFRETLGTIRGLGLGYAEIARLSGMSRSQVSRWSRAEHQPGYDGVRTLARALEAYGPEAAELGQTLLQAAGYGPIAGQASAGEAPAEEPQQTAEPPPAIAGDDDHVPPGGWRNEGEHALWQKFKGRISWDRVLAAIMTLRSLQDDSITEAIGTGLAAEKKRRQQERPSKSA